MPLQHALQQRVDTQPRSPFRSRSAPVALAADLKLCGSSLPQPLHSQAKDIILDLDIQYAAYHVSLGRQR